jgi:CRISPR-associated endonuclease Csy4
MEFYIDITLTPDAEIPVNRLLNAVYTKLHKSLVDLKADNIGVSFPSYHVLLGNCLRIHGSNNSLAELQQLNWVGGMSGYCQISDVVVVPQNCQFRTIKRIQTTMSQSKLKRLIKRASITDEEIKTYKAKMFSKGLDNPYVELESASNGHKHRRYISFGVLLEKPVIGAFDQFGLSKTATIPWF